VLLVENKDAFIEMATRILSPPKSDKIDISRYRRFLKEFAKEPTVEAVSKHSDLLPRDVRDTITMCPSAFIDFVVKTDHPTLMIFMIVCNNVLEKSDAALVHEILTKITSRAENNKDKSKGDKDKDKDDRKTSDIMNLDILARLISMVTMNIGITAISVSSCCSSGSTGTGNINDDRLSITSNVNGKLDHIKFYVNDFQAYKLAKEKYYGNHTDMFETMIGHITSAAGKVGKEKDNKWKEIGSSIGQYLIVTLIESPSEEISTSYDFINDICRVIKDNEAHHSREEIVDLVKNKIVEKLEVMAEQKKLLTTVSSDYTIMILEAVISSLKQSGKSNTTSSRSSPLSSFMTGTYTDMFAIFGGRTYPTTSTTPSS
jgi:hypothetical protein